MIISSANPSLIVVCKSISLVFANHARQAYDRKALHRKFVSLVAQPVGQYVAVIWASDRKMLCWLLFLPQVVLNSNHIVAPIATR